MCTRPYMKEGPIKCEWKHGESANTEEQDGSNGYSWWIDPPPSRLGFSRRLDGN